MSRSTVAAAALTVVAALAVGQAVAGGRVRADLPIYCGGHNGRSVALTFDDGPGATTPKVLRALKRYGARATFFVIGRRVAGHSSLVRQEAKVGEVGNHSWSHPNLSKEPSSAVFAQLERTQRAIRRGGAPTPMVFRPPYGKSNVIVNAEAASLGLKEIRSSVDSFDWRGASRAQIIRNVVDDVRPGSIVLMHDVITRTATGLPRLEVISD